VGLLNGGPINAFLVRKARKPIPHRHADEIFGPEEMILKKQLVLKTAPVNAVRPENGLTDPKRRCDVRL
jgi:hypothetical protein